MKTTNETVIGIVGSEGDLGNQLAFTAVERGLTVLRTDIKRVLGTVGLDTVLDESDIVHFCISEPDFDDSYDVRDEQLAILHDSVMATSERIGSERFNAPVDIVHMLMNQTNEMQATAVVDQSTPHIDLVERHIEDLGISPIRMSADEHDYIMARSQAPLAMLVQLLLPELQKRHDERVLTASGDALLKALEDRASRWTDKTMQAILKNPMLPGFLDDLSAILEKEEQSR